MNIQITMDINTKELAHSVLTYLVGHLWDIYDISEETISKDSLNLLIDEVYKEMKKEMEE